MRAIKQALAEAIERHVPLEARQVEGLLETPPSPELGDFALPCFALSKYMRRPPQQIAENLLRQVALPEAVAEARIQGAYLNFFLDRPVVTESVLSQVRGQGQAYGASDEGRGKTVVIDFGSPNIAKHLGVHHLPSAVIGRALGNLYRKLGYSCVGINFLGDWGTSFGKLIAAVERYGVAEPDRLTVEDLQTLYVRYNSEAATDPQLQQAARDAFRRLEQGEPDAVRLWQIFRDVSLREFDRVYGMLGVHFDYVHPESMYRERLESLLERMRAAGVLRESQGALIVPLDEEGLPPCLLRKSDGTSLYASRDIPAAEHRWEQFHFDRALYVVGNEQSLYFKQLKAVLKRMGHAWADRIVHVGFGLIKFRDPETGRARVGSTRRGQMVLLEDLLNEAVARARAKIEQNAERFDQQVDADQLAAQVGIGAVVFSELSTRRSKDVVFDWDRVLDFEGDSGPYVQYAHARLCSILRKAGGDVPERADTSLLTQPEEWALVRGLAEYPEVVRQAAHEYEPSVIATYLLQLCAAFSSYYSAGMRDAGRRVLCDDSELRVARLVLVDAVRQVIRDGLQLLGLEAPERM